MEIRLNQDSVVDRRTGQVDSPKEFLENLRQIERTIAKIDEDLAKMKTDVKYAREERERLIAQLRATVREGEPVQLPLFEQPTDPDLDIDEAP